MQEIHISMREIQISMQEIHISMEEPIFTQVARHFISMEEPKIITIGDVIDSTVMHINKRNPLFARESKGNPHGTQGNPVIRIIPNIIYY